jgi:hypothetical protein
MAWPACSVARGRNPPVAAGAGITSEDGTMSKASDFTGKLFGYLTVLRRHPENPNAGKSRWECEYACGNTIVVTGGSLASENTRSCGCYRSPDLVDKKYGRLTVQRLLKKRTARGECRWECLCECGKLVVVTTANLT